MATLTLSALQAETAQLAEAVRQSMIALRAQVDVTRSPAPPADLTATWFNTVNGATYVWYVDAWVTGSVVSSVPATAVLSESGLPELGEDGGTTLTEA